MPPNVTRARSPAENPERVHAGDRKNKRPFLVKRECMAGPVVVSRGESPENLQFWSSIGENLLVPRTRAPGTPAMVQRIYSSGDVHCHPLVGRGGFFGLSVELRRPRSTPYGRSRERRPSELVGSGSEASRIGSGIRPLGTEPAANQMQQPPFPERASNLERHTVKINRSGP